MSKDILKERESELLELQSRFRDGDIKINLKDEINKVKELQKLETVHHNFVVMEQIQEEDTEQVETLHILTSTLYVIIPTTVEDTDTTTITRYDIYSKDPVEGRVNTKYWSKGMSQDVKDFRRF